MRKIMRVLILAVFVAAITVNANVVKADTDLKAKIGAEPFEVEATAYNLTGITASGHPTVEGLTVAGAREWLGCAVCIWTVDEDGSYGDFLGIYQFTDTGGDYRLKNGTAIDIYMPDYDDCIQWGRRKVYIQIIDGEG